MDTGSLIIVGTGIQLSGHLTLAAQAWIEQADKVLFAVADPIMAKWLGDLNETAQALPYPADCRRRRDIYRQMIEQILAEVRQGQQVCVVFYGHPGVFVDPTHAAIKLARREGFSAQMLPAISAEACLFADLGLDPGRNGCQSFEATDFLIRRRQFDPHSALILWQIAIIGNLGPYEKKKQIAGLQVLTAVLETHYGPKHEVIVYEAAVYPVCQPVIQPIPLATLPKAEMTEVSTLYVPPKAEAPLDREMMARLGMFTDNE